MRRLWLIRSVCIALFSLYAYASYAQEVLGPKIVLQGREFDCGEVREGEVIEHSFSVFNQGDAPLEIVRVRPG